MANMRVPAVPTLSITGWITDPRTMLSQLLADMIVSEKSQTQWYYGEVVSLPAIVQQYGNKPDDFVTALKFNLEKLVSAHFATAEIEVTWEPMAGETVDHSRYNVVVLITAMLNGVKVNLAENFHITNNVFKRVTEVSNGD